MQHHVAAHAGVLAGAAGDREHGIAGIEERTLDRDLAGVEREGPEALPRLARYRAHAPAVVGADLLRVGRVVDLVGEGKEIAGAVILRAEIGDGVAGRML